MPFIILLLIFCYVIHTMCADRGLSPWGYLATFLGGYFLVFFGTWAAVVIKYGQNIISDPDIEKKLTGFIPYILISHFLLFFLFWFRLSRIKVYHQDEDDDSHLPPTPPNDKKDLSYFR